jgi:putative inorganic carbon (HCO3(-)) transporter
MDSLQSKPMVAGLAVLVTGLVAGVIAVGFVDLVKGKLALIAALPFVFAMGMLLLADKRKLFFLILLFRASGDLVLDATRFGGGMGVGGLINALVILLALMFVFERPGALNKRALSIWGPLLAVAFAAIFHAPELKEAVRAFLGLVSYMAVFIIAFYMVRSKDEYESAITLILLSSIIPVLYSLLVVAGKGGAVLADGFRLSGTFSHPNILAFYLVLNISLIFYRLKTTWVDAELYKKAALWGWMGIMLGLLVLTQTRSAWAAMFVIFAVYGLFFQQRYLLYLLFAPLVALLIPTVRDRLMDLGQGNEMGRYTELNSFAWRQLLWKHALEWMAISKSAFGYGLNSFKYFSPTFFPLAGGTNFGAHSTYVQWYFETGVIGVLAAAWMYVRLFFTLLLGIRQNRLGTIIVITLLIEYLFFAFSDNMLDYLAFNWYYWFFMGAACAMALRSPAAQALTREYEPGWSEHEPDYNFLRSNRQHEPRY